MADLTVKYNDHELSRALLDEVDFNLQVRNYNFDGLEIEMQEDGSASFTLRVRTGLLTADVVRRVLSKTNSTPTF